MTVHYATIKLALTYLIYTSVQSIQKSRIVPIHHLQWPNPTNVVNIMTICVPQVNALMLHLTTGHNSEFQTRKNKKMMVSSSPSSSEFSKSTLLCTASATNKVTVLTFKWVTYVRLVQPGDTLLGLLWLPSLVQRRRQIIWCIWGLWHETETGWKC